MNQKERSSSFGSLTSLLPADVALVVQGATMDLSEVSLFCRRQAECATVFGSIVQIKPGIFKLTPPFKESFISSLHCYVYPNMVFSPQETVAYALPRYTERYLRHRGLEALRKKAGTHLVEPCLLSRGPMKWREGVVTPTGEFTLNPYADGTPAMLAWQDSHSAETGKSEVASFALEIRGLGIAPQQAAFRKTLQSMVDCLFLELGLKRRNAGRPRLMQAEETAYLRDHRHAGRAAIATKLCSCGNSRHTQKCFDRLNKLADSFYRTQSSSLEKTVREQAIKYSEVKQDHI